MERARGRPGGLTSTAGEGDSSDARGTKCCVSIVNVFAQYRAVALISEGDR